MYRSNQRLYLIPRVGTASCSLQSTAVVFSVVPDRLQASARFPNGAENRGRSVLRAQAFRRAPGTRSTAETAGTKPGPKDSRSQEPQSAQMQLHCFNFYHAKIHSLGELLKRGVSHPHWGSELEFQTLFPRFPGTCPCLLSPSAHPSVPSPLRCCCWEQGTMLRSPMEDAEVPHGGCSGASWRTLRSPVEDAQVPHGGCSGPPWRMLRSPMEDAQVPRGGC